MHFKRILCSLLAALYMATAAVPVYTAASVVAPAKAEAGLASKAAKLVVAKMVGKAIKEHAKKKAKAYIRDNGGNLLRKGGKKATDLLLGHIKKNPNLRQDVIEAAYKFARANPRYTKAADQVVGLLKGGRDRVIALNKQKIPDVAKDAAQWVRPKGHRLPSATKGRWSGQEGNSHWRPDVLAVTKGESVPFVKGYPDFSKWSRGRYAVEGMDGSARDFHLAKKVIAEAKGFKSTKKVERYLANNRLAIHHHQDKKTVLLVPRQLHKLAHQGGASALRSGK